MHLQFFLNIEIRWYGIGLETGDGLDIARYNSSTEGYYSWVGIWWLEIVSGVYLIYCLVIFVSGIECPSIYYQNSLQTLGYSLCPNLWALYHALSI